VSHTGTHRTATASANYCTRLRLRSHALSREINKTAVFALFMLYPTIAGRTREPSRRFAADKARPTNGLILPGGEPVPRCFD